MPYINDRDNLNAFLTMIKELGLDTLFGYWHFRHLKVLILVKRVSMVLYVLLGILKILNCIWGFRQL